MGIITPTRKKVMKRFFKSALLTILVYSCVASFFACTDVPLNTESALSFEIEDSSEESAFIMSQDTVSSAEVESVLVITSSEEEIDETLNAEGFVELAKAVPDVILEPRYYSTYNFVGERIDGYEEPVILITKEAAEALKKVSDSVVAKGYRLKIYDAYRPQSAVDHFKRWASDPQDTKMKEYFYPEEDKSLLFAKGFIAALSGHSRGSTVDLTLFDMKTGQDVDMGGTFDYFGQLSYHGYTGITKEQQANRNILLTAMQANGFMPSYNEWWHYTLYNEPYPNTYFNFPVRSLN